MKRSISHQPLACSYWDPSLCGLLAEVVDDADGHAVLIPQLKEPLQEGPELVSFVLVGRPEHQIEWIEDQENWFDPLNILHQCFLTILVAQIEPLMIDQEEIEVMGEIE
jgi:hypothetical protein